MIKIKKKNQSSSSSHISFKTWTKSISFTRFLKGLYGALTCFTTSSMSYLSQTLKSLNVSVGI